MDEFLAKADLGWVFDIVTFSYGSNDFNHSLPPQDVGARAGAMARRLTTQWPEARVIAICPSHWFGRAPTNEGGWNLEDYRQAIAAAVRGCPGCGFANGLDLMPADPSLFVDGVHPNAAGMGAYARGMVAAIRRVM